MREINFDNIYEIPGLVGEITKEITETAQRKQPLISMQVALQAVGMAAAKSGIKSIVDGKMSIMTLSLAASSSGKNHPFEYMSAAARGLFIHCQGGVSSDKELLRNMVRNHGLYALNIDEVDGIFGKMGDKRNSFNSGIANTLLSMFTARHVDLNQKHKEEFIEELTLSIEKKIKKAEKERRDAGDIREYDESSSEEAACIKYIENGMPDPNLFFNGTTTPQAFNRFNTEENIERGILGRFLIVNAGEHRPEMDYDCVMNVALGGKAADKDFKTIQKIIDISRFCKKDSRIKLSSDSDSIDRYSRVIKKQALYDKESSGAETGRYLELVARVASIIAFGDSEPHKDIEVRDVHIDWADLLVSESVNMTVNSRISAGIGGDTDALSEIKAKILHLIPTNSSAGQKQSKVINNLYRYKKWRNLVCSIVLGDDDRRGGVTVIKRDQFGGTIKNIIRDMVESGEIRVTGENVLTRNVETSEKR